MHGSRRRARVSRRLLAATFLFVPAILVQPGLTSAEAGWSRHPAASYTITDLGTLGGSYTMSGAKAINATGRTLSPIPDPQNREHLFRGKSVIPRVGEP